MMLDHTNNGFRTIQTEFFALREFKSNQVFSFLVDGIPRLGYGI